MTLAYTKRIAGGAVGLAVGTLLALAAPLSFAQTTTPSAPETGAGGEILATLAVLAIAAVGFIVGSIYIARTRKEA